MADTLDLTTWSDSRSWVSNGARLQQETDSVDLQFRYGTDPTYTYTSAVRFLSNGDVRVFGELISETGAVRSYETIALTALETADDIVSFRSGGSAGTEMLRITAAGTVQSAEGASLSLKGLPASTGTGLSFDTGVAPSTLVRLKSAGTTAYTFSGDVAANAGTMRGWSTFGSRILAQSTGAYQTLTLEASTLELKLLDGGATERWGLLSTSSDIRVMAITDGTSAKELKLEADKFRYRDNGYGADWGEFFVSDFLFNPMSRMRVWNNFELKSQTSGGTWKDQWFWACNFYFINMCSDGIFHFKDSGEATRVAVSSHGTAAFTSDSSTSAEIELDSTATTNAKKWGLRSERQTTGIGSLKFVNLTDTGNPTVEITPAGSLYASGFVGPQVTSGAPSDSIGRVGAMAIDTTNKLIWVKVTDTGNGRWWKAALASP